MISTFAGCMGWKKLPQGLLVSHDHWDHVRESVLANCSNTISMRDDTLGGGKTRQEMPLEYNKVLAALKASGLTCDPSKNQVGLRKFTFFGMVFIGQGMFSEPKKVALIRNAIPPTSKYILNSFVFMVAWNDLFIFRFAEIVRPC